MCSLVVVRELVDYERFRDYKAGLPCFVIETCLVSMNSADRYRRSFYLTSLLPNVGSNDHILRHVQYSMCGVHVCMYVWHALYVCECMCMYVHVCMCVCMYVCMYVCMCVYLCIYVVVLCMQVVCMHGMCGMHSVRVCVRA